ncbi:MAG: glycosyltransferase [Acetobacteraceae bacterium]|nr:glycosyltransferase [Acetobacteraceae bacterium]
MTPPEGREAGADRPFVSVIIPHYNDLAGLGLCLPALAAQTWPRDRFEIVIADNNSRCGIEAVRAAAPGCRVVPAPIQGAGPARNAAAAAAKGEILAFTDSDCVPGPRWIEEGVAALGRFDFVGGQVVTTARDPARPSPVEAFEIVFNFDFRRYIEELGFTGTGNMFVPRPVFDRVGPFRTTVSEDMDWSFRARDAGFRIGYAPAAIVAHPARRDWDELRRRWARLVREHTAMARASRGRMIRHLLKALAMPLSVGPHAWRVLRSPRLPDLRSRIGAIGILARLRCWRMAETVRVVLRGR